MSIVAPATGLPHILLIDDTPADAKLVRRFAALAGVANPIDHLTSGPAALEHLLATDTLPGLVLLDINMPLMNGHEVLAAIRHHAREDIARLPVVFLTTSRNPDEVRSAYGSHANSYIVKPMDAAGFRQVLRSLADYWFHTVSLPVE